MTKRNLRLNFTSARQPSDDGVPEVIARIETLTKLCRANWLGLLAYLAFVGVTLMGVEDADFFLVERRTQLPLIGVTVPTNLFFYIAPTLGAMLYIHLHLYLLKLWRALGQLPERSDSPAGEKISPWIVSDMALSRRPELIHNSSLRSMASAVAFVSIFLLGPLVLAAFWWRSMPKHDELLTVIFCGLPMLLATLGSGLVLHS